MLDEAMVAVVADELSPLMTGLIYCSVILACREVYAFGRSRQWTVRAWPLVRCAAADRCLHRLVPRASRRDHAARGRLAARRSRRPAGPAIAFATGPTRSPRRPPSTSGRRCIGSAARFPPPRPTTGGQPVRLRAAAGPRAAAARARPQGRRSRVDPPGAQRDRRSVSTARGSCPRRSRSRSPPGEAEEAESACARARA